MKHYAEAVVEDEDRQWRSFYGRAISSAIRRQRLPGDQQKTLTVDSITFLDRQLPALSQRLNTTDIAQAYRVGEFRSRPYATSPPLVVRFIGALQGPMKGEVYWLPRRNDDSLVAHSESPNLQLTTLHDAYTDALVRGYFDMPKKDQNMAIYWQGVDAMLTAAGVITQAMKPASLPATS